MRTTLALDDDAAQAMQSFAEDNKMSLGKAASELIRRGILYRIPIKRVNGWAVFDVPGHFPKITTEQIKRLLEDEV
jgi:hypothetical protein